MTRLTERFAYECRSCGIHTVEHQVDADLPCPKCGSTLTPSPKARYWIFQFNPKTYGWFDRMNDTGGNKPELWLASRYAEYMKMGDLVAIRNTEKKDAGIYALGKLSTPAREMNLEKSDLKYWLNEQAADKFLYNRSVLVTYFRNLSSKPLLDLECSKDETLKDLKELTRQQATNIMITSQQWARIVELASKRT